MRTQARAVPYFENSRSVPGYVLYDIQPGSVWAKAGFKNRDAVLEVGGRSLTDIGVLIDGFQAICDGNVPLLIKRGHRKMKLNR